jgi:nucleoside-diphosphate-sugar epimerase
MHVFLTGATGFIGRSLTQSLLNHGHSITALVRNPNGAAAKWLLSKSVRLAEGDIVDSASLAKWIPGHDAVIHNAGYYEIGVTAKQAEKMKRINEDGTANILQACLAAGIPRTVYVSSVVAFGHTDLEQVDESFRRKYPPLNTYERTKTRAHETALDYIRKGLPLVIACPNGVVGVNDHADIGYYLRWYLTGTMLPVGWSPEIVQSLVYVDDLAEGIVLCLEKGTAGETYFLCGEAISRRDMFRIWDNHMGKKVRRLWLKPALAKPLFSPAAPLLRMLGLHPFMSGELVQTAMYSYNFSPGKAVRELGWVFHSAEDAWHQIIEGEKAKMARKKGWVNKLKPSEEY